MLIPLLQMVAAFQILYFYNLCVRVRAGIIEREPRAKWLAEYLETQK